METTIYLSYSPHDQDIAAPLRDALSGVASNKLIDETALPDASPAGIQRAIKNATHFVVLITRAARHTPTVRLSTLMARLAYDKSALCFVPVNIDGTQAMEVTRDIFCLHWRSGSSPHELVSSVTRRIVHSTPKSRLATSGVEAEKAARQGWNAEERHRMDRAAEHLHDALRSFEEAISLDFCAEMAWAGLARCLWKLREDNHAWKTIDVATEIIPGALAIKEVISLMHEGRR